MERLGEGLLLPLARQGPRAFTLPTIDINIVYLTNPAKLLYILRRTYYGLIMPTTAAHYIFYSQPPTTTLT